ncbi:hypothetical protein FOCC_FOCC011863 [Frankliniella occidentalis]|nr:hypothetical protein FOCC_FOCC011863 [Frankliniella occidentalis]
MTDHQGEEEDSEDVVDLQVVVALLGVVEVDLLVEWEWAVVALLLKEAVLSREVWVDLEVEETLLAEEVAETEEHSEVVDVVALSPEEGVVLNLEEGEVLNLVVVAVVLKDEAAGEAVLRVGDEEVDLKEEDVEVALKAGVEVALKAEAGEVLTGVVVADLQDQKDFLAHPNAWVDLLLVMTLHQSEEDLKDRKAAMAMGLLQANQSYNAPYNSGGSGGGYTAPSYGPSDPPPVAAGGYGSGGNGNYSAPSTGYNEDYSSGYASAPPENRPSYGPPQQYSQTDSYPSYNKPAQDDYSSGGYGNPPAGNYSAPAPTYDDRGYSNTGSYDSQSYGSNNTYNKPAYGGGSSASYGQNRDYQAPRRY